MRIIRLAVPGIAIGQGDFRPVAMAGWLLRIFA